MIFVYFVTTVVLSVTPTDSGRYSNLGQKVLGKNRFGIFYGVTPLNGFRLGITAEKVSAIVTPSKQEILTSALFTLQ